MKTNETFFEAWSGIVSNMMNNWKKTASNVNGEQKETADVFTKLSSTWMTSYRKLMEQAWKPFTGSAAPTPFSPFLNIKNASGDRVLDQLSDIHDVLNQFNAYTHSLTNTLINSANSFSALPGILPSFDSIAKLYPHTVSGWYMELFNSLQKSLNPFYHINNNFKWADPSLFASQTETLTKYLSKAARMQFLLGNTSVVALEKLIASVYDRLQNGKELPGTEDLYNEWSSVNEEEFDSLFHTEEYVMLQEDLMSLHSDITSMYDKQIETLMKPLPVVFKSDMDEVYKSNHDLRSRVNKLEKEMA